MVEKSPYPSLRTALWVYVVIFIGTMAIVLPLSRNIDPIFIRFSATVLISSGITFLAILLLRLSPGRLTGPAPQPQILLLSFVLGLVSWLPFFWLTTAIGTLLQNAVGALIFVPARDVTFLSYLVQFAILMPLALGFTFWMFLEPAATRALGVAGAALVGVLFGFYAMFSTDLGASAIPGYVLLGLLAAFLVYRSGCAWYGVALLSGLNIGLPLLRDFLTVTLFPGGGVNPDWANPFSLRWLLPVIICVLVAVGLYLFIWRQVRPMPQERVPAQRLWVLPVALSVILMVFSIGSEMAMRQEFRPRAAQPMISSPSTNPPVATPGK